MANVILVYGDNEEEILDKIMVERVPNEINWRTFLSICYATHYAGICLDLLKLYDSTDIPKEVFHSLKSYQVRVLSSNERLLYQYKTLEQIAEEEQLLLYPLKGITLMHHFYKRIYHRHISDIDVLIDAIIKLKQLK